MVKLWIIFTGYQTVFTISEHLMDIFAYMFITAFFLSAAYVASGFSGGARHQKAAVISGTVGALVCITNASGKIFSYLSPKFAEISFKTAEYAAVTELSVGFIMLAFCAYLCFGKDKTGSLVHFEALMEPEPQEEK
jgi:hypothetical protein